MLCSVEFCRAVLWSSVEFCGAVAQLHPNCGVFRGFSYKTV